MRRTLLTSCLPLVFMLSITTLHAQRIVVDEMLAVIPAAPSNVIVLLSDTRPGLDEHERTLEEAITEAKLIVDAIRRHMTVDNEVLEAMIASIQKRFGKTHDQLEAFFLERGFTFEDGCELLRNRKMIEDLISTMVRPPEPTRDDIMAYYQDHIVYEDARYTIRLATIERDLVPSIDDIIHRNAWSELDIAWDDEETYTEQELHTATRFVTDMQPGQIIVMGDTDDSYDLVQLVNRTERRALPINEDAIARTLKQEWFFRDMAVYQEKISQQIPVYYCVSQLPSGTPDPTPKP